MLVLDDSDGDATHPARLPTSRQALLRSLRLDNVSHWTVRRLSVVDTPAGEFAVVLNSGSSSNTLDALRVEHFYGGIEVMPNAHDNTIQNSLVGNMKVSRNVDGVCIGLQGYTTRGGTVRILGTRILNNEIFNCVDGIQAIANTSRGYTKDFSGTQISGNDIYLTPDLYSNCSGRRDRNGECACAENGIDIKSGAENASRPFVVSDNRIWGWRQTDTRCGGSGSAGDAIVTHGRSKNVWIEHNVIFDVPLGVTLLRGSDGTRVTGNLFYDMHARQGNTGAALATEQGVSGISFNGNTIVKASSWATVETTDSSLECNVVIDSGAPTGPPRNNRIDRNSYYNVSDRGWLGGNGDVVLDTAKDSGNSERCFDIKRISGAKRFCIPHGQSTSKSPHNACASQY